MSQFANTTKLTPEISIITEAKEDRLILYIDCKGEGTVSASGKNVVIASTRGNIRIPGTELTLGLNLYKKR